MGEPALHSPARCIGTLHRSRWLHTIWFPSLGLSHLHTCSQACGESVIVHFMVMNGAQPDNTLIIISIRCHALSI